MCGSLSILIVWKKVWNRCVGEGKRECVGEGVSEWANHVRDTVVGGSNKWGGVGTVSWWDVKDGGSGGIV